MSTPPMLLMGHGLVSLAFDQRNEGHLIEQWINNGFVQNFKSQLMSDAFCVSLLYNWNSFSVHMRLSDSPTTLKSCLISHLFVSVYHGKSATGQHLRFDF